MGKVLIVIGLAVAAIGVVLHWFPWLLSWFGRLPGDIRVERESGGFYFPIVSMLIVSIVASLLLNLFFRR
jgi:hypothetical protein